MRRVVGIIAAFILLAGLVVGVPAERAEAGTVDAAAEVDFVGRINALRQGWSQRPLQQHTVLINKARGWAQTMANAGHIYHSNLPSGVTVQWSVLGENVGVGPSVASLHDAFVRSSGHLHNLLDPRFNYVGVGVVRQGGRMWVSEVFMQSNAPPSPPRAPKPPPPPKARAVRAAPGGGYYVLRGNGTVEARGGATYYGSPKFGFDIARDLALMPDGKGYVVLDGFGGLWRYGSARSGAMAYIQPWYVRGFDIANSLAITPDGQGVAVLDGWGVVHSRGTAPILTAGPFWPGYDIARAIDLTDDGGVYILDGWGGVHALNGAPYHGNPYWRGWDIARDIVALPDGSGYGVLDGWGGVHDLGAAPPVQRNVAQALSSWTGLDRYAGRWWAVRVDGVAALT